MDDQAKKDHVNKILRIVSKVDYRDGSWIGAGFIDDPDFAGHNIGVRMVNKDGQQILGFEMNIQNLLILIQVVSVAIRMKVEEELTGLIVPRFKN